jgi:hypothetical protein
VLDSQREIPPNNWNLFEDVIDTVLNRSTRVADTLADTKPSRDDLSPAQREMLESHEYLLTPQRDDEQRYAALRAALLEYPDDPEDENRPTIDYSGLDPREHSRSRQYRYLTWGDETDQLTAPIGLF